MRLLAFVAVVCVCLASSSSEALISPPSVATLGHGHVKTDSDKGEIAGVHPDNGTLDKPAPKRASGSTSREELEEDATHSPKDDAELLPVTHRATATPTKTTTSVAGTLTTRISTTPSPATTTVKEETTPAKEDSTTTSATTGNSDTEVSKEPEVPSSSVSPPPIVPKCCPLGERVLVEKKQCHPSALEFIPPFLYESGDETVEGTVEETTEETYDIIVGNPCKYGRYRLEPHTHSDDEFYLLTNGSLVVPYLFEEPLRPDEFCMDVFPDTLSGQATVLPLVCSKPADGVQHSHIKFILYPIGLLSSVPFLLVTLIVYAITPALRDVHGKSLICHVSCLTVAYVTLACVQLWGSSLSKEFCAGIAFLIQFSFVACFFWLNVMCINTWWNMSHRAEERWCQQRERRHFVLYSMYAWSLPCVLISVSLVMELTPTIPSSYLKPRFGVESCWFQSDTAALPYYYGPVSVLIFVNLVLFLLTARSVRRQSHPKTVMEARSLTANSCFRRHRKSAFRSCFFLFCAMGINWVMDVVSWAIGGPDYIWYATDVLNTLQGVIIFIVFVLDRPVRQEFRARIRSLRSRGREERRAPDLPQIDDFRTVVNRSSRIYPQKNYHSR